MGSAAAARVIETPWMTTIEAAEYCRMTRETLLMQVHRGNLVPDSWGKRGRTASHRFKRDTLDRFLQGG
jgi:hypothetical protein